MFALNMKIYIDFHKDSTKILTKIYAKFRDGVTARRCTLTL
jgi:hypothetical protein